MSRKGMWLRKGQKDALWAGVQDRLWICSKCNRENIEASCPRCGNKKETNGASPERLGQPEQRRG